jgi:hypothetical protein
VQMTGEEVELQLDEMGALVDVRDRGSRRLQAILT